jgi:acetyltransferase-like isoleucine patch superfamily enzyme
MKGYIKGSVFIGKFSFIGPHVTIMPNTKIGKGSIVSSHSYVSGEFPDFSIIGGNPAKIIGDTRTKDSLFFEQNPELKKNYDDWTNA